MDESVIRAMQKWPNVPHVYGWLRLDRRGNWLVKARAGNDGAPIFERITNAAVNEFIGRNYHVDEAGRWFFQNGPQRVFVALDYTPFVYRFAGDGRTIETHAGLAARECTAAWIDDGGMLVLETEHGPGVVLDRDLPQLLERIEVADGGSPPEAVLAESHDAAGPQLVLALGRRRVPLKSIAAAEVPARFGFNPSPRPATGEPEC